MTERKYFGTDGIRGRANTSPMTAEMALKVAMAAAIECGREGDHWHRVVIGKDTRLSGYMIEQALASGFVSMGMDVVLVGPMPTPAIAMLTRSLRADLGVMISASHNPYEDNGIKLFGADGYKLDDAKEARIETLIDEDLSEQLAEPQELGRASRLDDAIGRYIEYAKASFPKGQRLSGMKIVVDCANGAAYRVAPQILWELEAEVIPIFVNPNGKNINQNCGATDTKILQETVVANNADLGIALDGDADRLIMVDEKGQRIDGDQLMAVIARSWQEQSLLRENTVVSTVMSNLGFERFLADLSINLVRTAVGDRYVVEHMRQNNLNLGGEQSGHIVLGDYATTGDGLMAALQVLSVIESSGRPASKVCNVFDPLPQILKNVRFQTGTPLEHERVKLAISEAEGKLSKGGRLLVRPSGTEPVIRVMAEGDNADLVDSVVNDVCSVIEDVAKPA